MADGLEFSDARSLQDWLDGKPREWAELIALRAALRVFPVVAVETRQRGDKNPAIFRRLTLAAWRCLFISSVARRYPTDEMRAAAAAAAAASARTASAFASAARDDAWGAVGFDCAVLARDGPERLVAAPLWLAPQGNDSEPLIATPDWAAGAVAEMDDELTRHLGPDAGLIAAWYRPLLNGNAGATWSRMFMGEQAQKLALKKDAFWKVTNQRPDKQVMEEIAGALGWAEDSDPEPIELPPFGKQGAGAKLGIVGGVVALATPQSIPDDGNDYDRIGKFLPMAREAIEELLASIPKSEAGFGNDPHFRLRNQALNYLKYSNAELMALDYDLLFGVGTMLQNRLAAAEKPALEPDLVPLTDRQLTALRDFRATHGPMITASTDGQKLIKDADEFERNPIREREYRAVAGEFAEQLQENPLIVDKKTADLVKDAVGSMGQGDQAERAHIFGLGTITNVGIVLTAASTVAIFTAAGAVVLGLPSIALSAPLSLVVLEATKKSKALGKVVEPVREFMDKLSDDDGKRLEKFIREVDGRTMTRFTLQQEERIRRMVGDRPEYKWLRDQLDWIKTNKPEDF